MTFSFGQSEYERLEIDVVSYERSPVGEYYDDNWLKIMVRISAGGFRGEGEGAFLTGEIDDFLRQLRALYDSLSGTAEFNTLERQLSLKASGDGKGHVELVGELVDDWGSHNRLNFTLKFDQSQLAASIREMETVMEAFPVR